LIDIFQNIILQ